MKNIFLNKERNVFLGKGRIRRSHYICAKLLLAPLLCIVAYVIVASILFLHYYVINNTGDLPIPMPLSAVTTIFFYWINIGLDIMRSHDIGKSGWYILIPFYGLWLIFVDSERGTNQYGQNPKGDNDDKEF